MMPTIARRDFIKAAAAWTAAGTTAGAFGQAPSLKFELSLVESSLKRALADKTVDHLDLAKVAKSEFGIAAVEYGSQFFRLGNSADKYVDEMNKRAAEHGVRQLLITIDGEGQIGDPENDKRKAALRAHCRWVDVAKALGCHSVQVNVESSGAPDEQFRTAVAGLNELCDYAGKQALNVLVGNYGGLSANAAWVERVVKGVDLNCCRVLPQIRTMTSDDDYRDLTMLVPLAKGVTASAKEFDAQGNEKHVDYFRAMQLIQKEGYHGYVGISYCGSQFDEAAGIRATKTLLDRVRSGG